MDNQHEGIILTMAWIDFQHAFVRLSVGCADRVLGDLTMELFTDVCPKTCQNFSALISGHTDSSGSVLSYKDSAFHRLVPGGWIQGGGTARYGGVDVA